MDPGDFRPGRPESAPAAPPQEEPTSARGVVTSLSMALVIALFAALTWAVLRGILEVTVGLLVVSGLGGWVIGVAVRQVSRSELLAAGLGGVAWLGCLVLTWIVSRLTYAEYAGSVDLLERLRRTTFLDFTAQQFGLPEIAGLVLFVGAAALAASRRASAAGRGV